MRHTQLGSKRAEAGPRPGWSWRSGTLVLRQLAVVLIAINAYGQPAYLSSPKQLLETDPGAFAQWLKANRPTSVSAHDKARVLASLPAVGEITDLNAPSLRKLASLGPLLRATARDAAYELKVIDVPQVRVGLYERTVVLISETALTLLDAEELQAQVVHEIAHEYVWVEHAHASAREDRGRLKDLELLCDAIAIVTLQGLGMNSALLMTGIEKITRYNWTVRGTAIDESNYPTLSERRAFARAVTAWVTRETSSRGGRNHHQ